MSLRALIVYTSTILCSGGCLTSSGFTSSSAPISIATLDLFTQDIPPRTGKPWAGDWKFRRDRLELVDLSLSDLRPDILLFQNALRRPGSVSESDELILTSGALERYDWTSINFETLGDTGEERLFVSAVIKPMKNVLPPAEEKKFWQFGGDGYMGFFRIEGNGQPLLVFNVIMPSKSDGRGLWYSFVEERAREIAMKSEICLRRVIFAGSFAFEQESRLAGEFLQRTQFKDTATGFCQNAEQCQTATPKNSIFQVARAGESPSHIDRILVHSSAGIISSSVAFNRTQETNEYKEAYGLTKIFPAMRFGWITRVRFANCPNR